MPITYQFVIAILGLGITKALLDRYAKRLGELSKWSITIALLLLAVWAGNLYQERHTTQWQPLTKSQLTKLETSLGKSAGGKVKITVDANTLMLGQQLASAFEAAGWPKPEVGGPSFDLLGAVIVGVTILVVPNDHAADAYYNSMKDFGFDPQFGRQLKDDRKHYDFEILLGPRQQ